MEDIIDIIVTETTNLIEITSQPTDEIIDVNIIDNREDVTLNVTPTVVEININSLTGNFGVNWGEIAGTLSNQTDLQNALNLKADLVGGKVPSSQLPSYVDDVVEVANYASLPATGETGKIYVVLDTNLIYRWSGSAYIEIKDSSAVWGAITGTLSSQTDLQNALNAKANDNAVVHLAGTETITGAKTFSSAVTAPNFVLSGGTGNTGLYYGHTDRVVLANYTAGGIDFEVNGGFIVATLFPSGNYGLGITLDAGYKLDVNGTARISGALSGTSASFSSSITSSSIIKSGGTSSQFLKADGSVDSTSYQPLLTNPVTGTGTSGIVAVFNGTSSITDSTIYANSTRVSIGADVTTTNRFTAVSSTTSAYAIVAQASSAAHGIWSNVLGSGEIFRGQTAGGSYFIINNGGNAFLNGNLNVGDFASTSYRLNVVGTANFTGALSGTSATFSGNVTIRPSTGYNAYFQTSGTSVRINYLNDALSANVGAAFRATDYSFQDSTGSPVFTIASTGVATFSSSVTATSATFSGNISMQAPTGVGTFISFKNDSNTSGFDIGHLNGGGAGAYIYQRANQPIIFGTNNAEIVRFLANGNVGIGTTAPSYLLHVKGSGAYNGAIFADNTGTTAGGSFQIGVNGTAVGSISVAGTYLGSTDQNLAYYAGSGLGHIWYSNAGSERMRITSGGNVLIGTTSDNSNKLQTYGNIVAIHSSSGSQCLLSNNTSNSTTYGWYNSGNGNFVLTNSNVANVGYFNMSTGVYVATSDRNKKKDFEDSTIGLNEVMQLKPTLYRMKSDEFNGQKELGFIAQDVRDIIPYAYEESGDMIGLNFNPIVAALTKAVQELKAELDTLKNK